MICIEPQGRRIFLRYSKHTLDPDVSVTFVIFALNKDQGFGDMSLAYLAFS